MKQLIHAEGFKNYPTFPANAVVGNVMNCMVPMYDGNPCWSYQYFSYSSTNKLVNNFVFENVTYQGLVDMYGGLSIKASVPKMTVGEKKRFYLGVRMISDVWNKSYPFFSTNASSSSGFKFNETTGGSKYIEVVFDASTKLLSVYINKVFYMSGTPDTTFTNTLATGKSLFYVGSQGTGARVGSSKGTLYTDIYYAIETWDTDEAPPIDVYGPISVDSYLPKSIEGEGFASNVGALTESIGIPITANDTTSVLTDKAFYTSNDENVGVVKFQDVPVSDKIIGGVVSVVSSRGGSTSASLYSTVKSNNTTIASDVYIPPLFSDSTLRMKSYYLGEAYKTAEALNGVTLELYSKL